MVNVFQTLGIWLNSILYSIVDWIESIPGVTQILISVSIFGVFSGSILIPMFHHSGSDVARRKDI